MDSTFSAQLEEFKKRERESIGGDITKQLRLIEKIGYSRSELFNWILKYGQALKDG